MNAEYFSHCTSSYLAPDADVVLVEVANNLWGTAVGPLLAAVREASPKAAVAFVNWRADPPEIERAARQGAADVVRVGKVVNELDRKRAVVKRHLFAKYGHDWVHPSARGHAFMGLVAARYVAARWAEGGERARVRVVEASQARSRAGTRSGRGARAGDGQDEVASNDTPSRPRPWETCYTRADRLPLLRSTTRLPATAGAGSPGWSLIDEGGTKGVTKLGLASWHVGDTLDIGPIPGPHGVACTAFDATLGYLLSSSRTDQGAFSISCAGSCHCAPFASPKPALYPFSLVDTDARRSKDDFFRQQPNVSVTATTSFLMLWRATDTSSQPSMPVTAPAEAGTRSRRGQAAETGSQSEPETKPQSVRLRGFTFHWSGTRQCTPIHAHAPHTHAGRTPVVTPSTRNAFKESEARRTRPDCATVHRQRTGATDTITRQLAPFVLSCFKDSPVAPYTLALSLSA